MQKQCKQCASWFEINQEDLNFYDKVSPIFNWKKYSIPAPTQCPDCRQQRRLGFRNERNIYERKSDFNWKKIISIYSPDKAYKIFEKEYWWSDKYNGLDYWIDFNFDETFFSQLKKLYENTPKMSLYQRDNENSEYSNHCDLSKDCYLTFASVSNENCIYWNYINNSKNCIDNLAIRNCELCYECTDCVDCYNIKHSENSKNCSNSYFLYNCQSCKHCFLCSNLRNKEFCINNKQYSKDEYFKKISNLINLNESRNKFNALKLKSIRKNISIENSENSSWDLIKNSKNCYDCFDLQNSENCKYVYYWNHVKDCYDIMAWYKTTELSYESIALWNPSYDCKFCFLPWMSSYLMYCMSVINSEHCFWCVDLQNAKYCILNKQYTKEQYEVLVPKVIEHMKTTWEWWEFFPIELSPFAYNETVAQEYFPMTKEECLNTYSKWLFNDNVSVETRSIASLHKGWKWKDQEDQIPNVEKIIPAGKLPNNISDIPDDILNWAISCELSERPFKIIPQELKFYREHDIPIPHLHPDERHKSRMKLRNPRRLYDRKCKKCEKDIKTTYAPGREEMVYCEECYLHTVY